MKKLFIILSIAAAMTLIGALAAWACCGGSYVIELQDILVDPHPVPCEGPDPLPTTISFVVYAGMEWNYMDQIMGQVDIYNADGDLVESSGPMLLGVIDLDDWSTWKDYFPGSYEFTAPGIGGETYTYVIMGWTQDDAGGTTAAVVEAGEFDVDLCCTEVDGVSVRITPETFNVQRAGNWVMGHMILPEGLTSATIVSIGGLPASIPGMIAPDEPIKFSSAEFSAVAGLIVPMDGDRAEGVVVEIELGFADGTKGCETISDEIDIINEGKKNN